MTRGGEQRMKWVSQPKPLSLPLQECEEAHREFAPIPLALKADTGKRQGKEKTRKGQDKNVEKGEGEKAEAGVTDTCGLFSFLCDSIMVLEPPQDNLWIWKKFFKGFYSLMIF